jgi:threonine dehydratase
MTLAEAATSRDSEFVTFAHIEAAAGRLHGQALRTAVVTSRTLDARLSCRLFFKCENLQRSGSFKFRGAYNAMAQLDAASRAAGVLTYSSGNHAQAVALAGRELSIPTTIVMPTDSPAVKQAATRGYGGEVVLYARERVTREELGAKLAAERGLTIIPPYDHAEIIAGQGTAAGELFSDVGPLDVLLVPCGGGGLLSGSAIAAAAMSPACRVIGVEPAAADDATKSFRTGKLHVTRDPVTIADGARTPSLGQYTFPLVRRYVDDMVTVTDAMLIDSMRLLWERMKLVVEPTGALGAAAALHRLIPVEGRRVGVILSGGNVELARVAEWFGARDAASPDITS